MIALLALQGINPQAPLTPPHKHFPNMTPSALDRQDYLDDPTNYFYGVVCLTCFLFGITLNFISLFYFTRRPRHLSTIVYISIITTDLIISALSLPVGVSYISHRAALVFQFMVFCQAWGILWNAAARMSVFLVAVLCISRTLNLKYPFKVISRRVVVTWIVGYGVIQLAQSTIPYWFGVVYEYYETHVQCQWFFEDIKEFGDSDIGTIIYSLLMGMELVLPVLPIIASCLISIRELNRQGQAPNRQVTQTVLIFTFTYITLNIPFCCYYILANIDRFTGHDFAFFQFDQPSHNLRAFVVVISVVINSAVNPIIYLARFRRLRMYVVKVARNNTRTNIWMKETSCYSQSIANYRYNNTGC